MLRRELRYNNNQDNFVSLEEPIRPPTQEPLPDMEFHGYPEIERALQEAPRYKLFVIQMVVDIKDKYSTGFMIEVKVNQPEEEELGDLYDALSDGRGPADSNDGRAPDDWERSPDGEAELNEGVKDRVESDLEIQIRLGNAEKEGNMAYELKEGMGSVGE